MTTPCERAWIDKLNEIFPVGSRWTFARYEDAVYVVTDKGAYCMDGKFYIDTIPEKDNGYGRKPLGLAPHMLTKVDPERSELERLRLENEQLRRRCAVLGRLNNDKMNRIAKLRECLG